MTRNSAFSAVLLAAAFLFLAGTGFQCSSPYITSGKMEYQKYVSSKDTTKLNAALDMFQKEVTERPNSAEGWYWLGLIQGEKKQFMRLKEAWDQSLKLGPAMRTEIENNTPAFWYRAFTTGANAYKKAQVKKDKNLYRDAADYFHAAIELAPDSSAKYGVYVNYADALMQLGEYDEAARTFQAQITRVPNATAYYYLALIYRSQAVQMKSAGDAAGATKKLDQAINIIAEGLTKFPQSPELQQERVNAYLAAGREKEVLQELCGKADANPNDKVSLYACGTVLLENKESERAAGYLEKAVTLDPKFDNAVYNLCVAYLRWGVQVRDEESARNPETQSGAYKDIIRKAIPHVKNLTTLKGDNLQYWELAGKIYASLGMEKEASEAYNKVDQLRK
jgi:tetratricopeptide (TPR) repeat protein